MTRTVAPWTSSAWSAALERLDRLVTLEGYPAFTQLGRWHLVPKGEERPGFWPADMGWIVGFLPGMLWLAYRVTHQERYVALALEWCRPFVGRQADDTTHDLGFVFFPSYVQGYTITGERWLRDAAIGAARTLGRRFNEAGGFLRAWGPVDAPELAGKTTIDAMMNLALLYWAARETGDERLAEWATRHAETTARTLVRADASTFHVYEFDPHRGTPLRGSTHQGFSDNSAWARGQAWGLYGFARAGQATGRADFLAVAQRLADFFVEHLPDHRVPPWDFRAPGAAMAARDSSAGAIAASGLLLLSAVLPSVEGQRYEREALRLLEGLWHGAGNPPESDADGLLLHATLHKPAGRAVDEALVFGDYYFMEALARLLDEGTAAA
ncbi:MAG TPA: glycoside hydrolase family 88 protein [Chloroflexota bacterium]